ncbi:MAG: pyridoxal-phosphate dependent enzyme, partial [Synergistaceae bacterium]|nr:pyridoxal-phosphate dependent enzyme [Synergistaceae bacterium]
FAALGKKNKVIGVGDDDDLETKKNRVAQLANDSLEMLGLPTRVGQADSEVISVDKNFYGVADEKTYECIRLLAQKEGIVVDPVYEGKALRGLIELARNGRFEKGANILLMHLGGTPAVHAYANQFGDIKLLNVNL